MSISSLVCSVLDVLCLKDSLSISRLMGLVVSVSGLIGNSVSVYIKFYGFCAVYIQSSEFITLCSNYPILHLFQSLIYSI